MQVKECGKCGVTKSIEDFYRDKTRKDGREWICKVCKEAYKRALRERKKKGHVTARAETTWELPDVSHLLKLPEKCRCSFCGEIKKEEDMVWYSIDSPLSDDGTNICKECYEKKD